MSKHTNSQAEGLRAVIIDDERHCRETLCKLLEWADPTVSVLQSFGDPKRAIEFLNSEKVDIVFLDIEMPEINGFELLTKLKEINFDIVFTTAYDEFALKAFEVQALAYLLKPIGEEELTKVILLIKSKSPTRLDQDKILSLFENLKQSSSIKKVAFPTSEGLEFIRKENIIRCASDGNYTRVFIKGQNPLLISKTLKVVNELIDDEEQFVRPHASHLINLDYVAKYIKGSGGQLIMDDGFVVPVSKLKKSKLFDSFG